MNISNPLYSLMQGEKHFIIICLKIWTNISPDYRQCSFSKFKKYFKTNNLTNMTLRLIFQLHHLLSSSLFCHRLLARAGLVLECLPCGRWIWVRSPCRVGTRDLGSWCSQLPGLTFFIEGLV